MKTILITSSGFLRKPVRDEILKILPEDRPLRVAYIPTASNQVDDDSYAKRDEEIMEELGIEIDTIDLEKVQKTELEERLRRADFIYVQGGNPYLLLKYMRESGFDEIVPQLIEQGVPYIGKSAGAYILAPEVIVPQWLEGKRGIPWNRNGIDDVRGMGVVRFVWVAHYSDDYKDAIEKGMQQTKYRVRAITNDQAFLITDNGTELVGEGDEVAFPQRREDGELFQDTELKG